MWLCVLVPYVYCGTDQYFLIEACTHHLFEQFFTQLNIQKTVDELLSWCTGHGPELGLVLILLSNVRQAHCEELNAVIFSLSCSRNHVWVSRMVHAICHQQDQPYTVGWGLMHEHLRGVCDGVGRVGSVANVAHGVHTAVERVQVFPGGESLLHRHVAAVLKRGQSHL